MTSLVGLLVLLIQSVVVSASDDAFCVIRSSPPNPCVNKSQVSAPTFAPANDHACSIIPFELIDNRIVINIKLNGKTFRVMFDSGAGYIIAPEVVKGLGLKVESAGQSGGVGEKTV